jgi:nitrate reductase NapAB chaperone NapD
MAIAGLLVHTLKDRLLEVEAALKTRPGFTTYGTHEGQFIVVVAEAPAEELEDRVEALKNLPGVLTVYTTYVTIEDELGDAQH